MTRPGLFIAIVGPDGVGKTSVAAEVVRRIDGRYFHFRPSVKGLWDQPESGSITVKVIERPSGLVGSAMRLVKALALFWAGYLRTVRPELRRNGVVVCDRWAFGYLAKPEELRYFGPRWLAVLSVRMLPKPDLVVSLNASPDIVVARKPELTTHEAAIDARAWSGLPVPGLVQVDAERSLDAIVKEILELGGLENREHQN